MAKERDNREPILILLGDKIFETGYQKVLQNPYTVIGVKAVENPQGVGIVEMEGKFIARLIEKPQNPPTNLVIEGLYYIQNSELLFHCLDEIIEKGIRTHNEYQLTDGLQLMLEYGEEMKVEMVNSLHCGTPDQLLAANRSILEKRAPQNYRFPNSVIIPPVFIGGCAVIENAIIGPYASIGRGRADRQCSYQRCNYSSQCGYTRCPDSANRSSDPMCRCVAVFISSTLAVQHRLICRTA